MESYEILKLAFSEYQLLSWVSEKEEDQAIELDHQDLALGEESSRGRGEKGGGRWEERGSGERERGRDGRGGETEKRDYKG